MSPNFEPGIAGRWYGEPLLAHTGSLPPPYAPADPALATRYQSVSSGGASISPPEDDDILAKIRGKELWIVNSRRRNGLIIHKEFYTEFAGPGAAIGGCLDADCRGVIPLGSLSLIAPTSAEEQQKALKIRLQWVRLTQNFTDKPVALDRARMILEQFKSYFDPSIVDQVPDEAFALLVGVLPYTVRQARALV
jgi:hypothetical protein